MKYLNFIINIFTISFLLFVLVSCEKIKDIFTDEYAFLKGEWVLEEMDINESSSYSFETSRSSSISYSYENDSISYSYYNYYNDFGPEPEITQKSSKSAYALELIINDSVQVIASVNNKTLEVERDTNYIVPYYFGEFENYIGGISSRATIPDEKYDIKISFCKNRFFLFGDNESPNYQFYCNLNNLYIKKTQVKNQLILEYSSEFIGIDDQAKSEYKYVFKRKE